ncbi:hypothetical protein HK100_000691 [Physocladia obscura]|uniref:Uncharacterized protein n=1 Tax=Physocladia obscura TaxID=109957 RepID=A0AAD5TAH7_9FUNG|nr:hypothetical protein HK100_000691 [Physocladia obscura]
MGPFGFLLSLCAAMFSGAFIAGSIPLAFSFSESRLVLVSTFGSGLLLGTAFSVILPEFAQGVDTLYSAATHIAQESKTRGSSNTVDNHAAANANTNTNAKNIAYSNENEIDDVAPLEQAENNQPPAPVVAKKDFPKPSLDASKIHLRHENQNNPVDEDIGQQIDLDSDNRVPTVSENHVHHSKYNPSKYIGPSLILGFLLMLLIDQISGGGGGNEHASHSHSTHRKVLPHHAHSHASSTVGEKEGLTVQTSAGVSDGVISTTSSATIGLVVHAAADGIALGAALSSASCYILSGEGNLGFIVFLAIMLHKAPSAFGLTTHLLKTYNYRGGISTRARIRSQLFLFSISAPIGAILTYTVLVQLGYDGGTDMKIYTGIALLFSAGTFLYAAAVHVLPEIYGEDGKLTAGQVLALVTGILIDFALEKVK